MGYQVSQLDRDALFDILPLRSMFWQKWKGPYGVAQLRIEIFERAL